MGAFHRVCLLAAIAALLTFAPVHAAGIPVDGIVFMPGGRPIAGARIELHQVPSLYEAGLRELQGGAEPQSVARVRANGEGQFQFAVPQAGLWRVVVSAKGFVSRQHEIPITEATSLPSAELQPDMGLKVRVEDAAGRPIQGAKVVAVEVPPSWLQRSWEPIRYAGKTRQDGTLRIPAGPEASLRLWAVASGHPPGEARTAERERSVTIRLPRGTSRRVQVSSAEGGTVPGALLWHLPSRLLLGRTGRAGKILLSLPAQGGYEILASDGQNRTITTTSRKIVLPSKTLLSGQVIDFTSRQPVRGAFVWTEMDPGAFVQTDEKGFYRMPWDPGKGQSWIVAASGYLLEREPLPRAGATKGLLDFALRPDLPLQGQVVDEAGKPVPGAEVQLYLDASGASSWDLKRSRTDMAGRFRITGLCRECVYHLRASLRGFAPEVRTFSVPAAGPNPDFRIVLGRGRTVTGLVLDPEGRPVPGARVELIPLRSEELWIETIPPVGSFGGITGTDGRFAVPNVPRPIHTVRMEAPGFSVLVKDFQAHDAPGEIDLGRFELTRPGIVSGYVYDSAGRPAAGAQVWAQAEDDPGLEQRWQSYLASGPAALTGPDGSYTVQAPPGGLLYFCWKGNAEVLFLDEPDSDPTRVVMRPLVPTARITGRVLDSSGRPVAGAEVYAGSLGGCGGVISFFNSNPCQADTRLRQSDVSDEDGRFTLVAPAYDKRIGIWADAEGFVDGEWEVEIQPEQTSEEMRLVLDTGSVITGRVLGPDGAPVAGAEVSLDMRSETRTDTRGDFRLTGVPPGSHDLSFRHPEQGDATSIVETSTGEHYVEVKLDGETDRWLKGRVIDSTGGPVAGAQVFSGALGAHTFTAGDGTFHLRLWNLESGSSLDFGIHPPGQAPSFWRQDLEGAIENGVEILIQLP